MMDYQMLTVAAQAARGAELTAHQAAVAQVISGFFVILMVVNLVIHISMFGVFRKAGRKGWKAFVPGYNLWVTYEIAGWPGKWSLLCYLPLAWAVVFVMLALRLAKVFGKGNGFAAALLLVPYVAFPILAFGRARYELARVGQPGLN